MELKVAYRTWSLTRIEQGVLFREKVRTHLPIEDTVLHENFFSVTICVVLCCRQKFFIYMSGIVMHQVTTGKKTKKYKNVSGRGRLQEVVVPTVRLRLGNVSCFGYVIAYQRWSHMEVRL